MFPDAGTTRSSSIAPPLPRTRSPTAADTTTAGTVAGPVISSVTAWAVPGVSRTSNVAGSHSFTPSAGSAATNRSAGTTGTLTSRP